MSETAKKPTALVVVCGDEYKRFVGKNLTNHIASDRPLTASEIEKFRVDPMAFIEPEAA